MPYWPQIPPGTPILQQRNFSLKTIAHRVRNAPPHPTPLHLWRGKTLLGFVPSPILGYDFSSPPKLWGRGESLSKCPLSLWERARVRQTTHIHWTQTSS